MSRFQPVKLRIRQVGLQSTGQTDRGIGEEGMVLDLLQLGIVSHGTLGTIACNNFPASLTMPWTSICHHRTQTLDVDDEAKFGILVAQQSSNISSPTVV